MNCIACQAHPRDGVTVFRLNAKGQPGLWACEQHYRELVGKPDEELLLLTRIIEEEARRP